MSSDIKPYYPSKPGDPILAEDWNNLQIQTRRDIREHTHSGGEQGVRLDGKSIDPNADLVVRSVDMAKLTVNKTDVMAKIAEIDKNLGASGNRLEVVERNIGLPQGRVPVSERLDGLDKSKLALSGGAITGGLTIQGDVGIGTAAKVANLEVTGKVSVTKSGLAVGPSSLTIDEGCLAVSKEILLGPVNRPVKGSHSASNPRCVISDGSLQIRREKGAKGATVMLELFQDAADEKGAAENINILFHHSSHYWYRMESRSDGFHFMQGAPTSGDHVDCYAQNFSKPSSRKLKENISPILLEEAQGVLQGLKPVRYDLKERRSFRQKLGFIAEEMPDEVASEDRKTITPDELIPILTRVMQGQQEAIARLEGKLSSLEAELAHPRTEPRGHQGEGRIEA